MDNCWITYIFKQHVACDSLKQKEKLNVAI